MHLCGSGEFRTASEGFGKTTDTWGRSAQRKTCDICISHRSLGACNGAWVLALHQTRSTVTDGRQAKAIAWNGFLKNKQTKHRKNKFSDNVHFAPHAIAFEKNFLTQFANSSYRVLSFLRYSPTILRISCLSCYLFSVISRCQVTDLVMILEHTGRKKENSLRWSFPIERTPVFPGS